MVGRAYTLLISFHLTYCGIGKGAHEKMRSSGLRLFELVSIVAQAFILNEGSAGYISFIFQGASEHALNFVLFPRSPADRVVSNLGPAAELWEDGIKGRFH
jgi:hypothetical protein